MKKKIVAAAAKKMNCAPEDVIMRDDRVWRRGTDEPTTNGAHAEKLLEKIDAPRGNVKEVSGRVEGQIAARIIAAEAERRRAERAHEL